MGFGVRLTLAILLLAATCAIALLPALDHRPFEAGLFDTLLRFDTAPALVGLALALQPVDRRRLVAMLVLVLVGLPLGALIGDRLAAAITADFHAMFYAALIGPLHLIVVGIALAAPTSARPWALPPAAVYSGAVLGLAIDPRLLSPDQLEFAAGVIFGGVTLVPTPLLVLRDVRWEGLPIASRIFGSWLIAIGLMLTALNFADLRGGT